MNIDRIASRSSIRVVDYSTEYASQAVEIAREMHANSVYRDMPLDEEKTIRQLNYSGTEVAPDRYFRIAVRGDELMGGFYGIVRRTFFCDEINAHDLGWWVKQTARGSAAAVLLLNDFSSWARAKGARLVMVGQSTGINIERTTRLYEHCGFRVIGFNTVKEL